MPRRMLVLIALAEFLGMTLWFSATAAAPAVAAEFAMGVSVRAWLTMAVQAARLQRRRRRRGLGVSTLARMARRGSAMARDRDRLVGPGRRRRRDYHARGTGWSARQRISPVRSSCASNGAAEPRRPPRDV